MSQSELFSVIESGIYLFGGHLEDAQPGWSYPKFKHELFELNYVLHGTLTITVDGKSINVDSGKALIISPETYHESFNQTDKSLRMFCFHFNVSDLKTKSLLIRDLSNFVIKENTEVSSACKKIVAELIALKKDNNISVDERKIRNEISFLHFMIVLNNSVAISNHEHENNFSEREVSLAKSISNKITNEQELWVMPMKFGNVCKELNLSTVYGHKIFKKVYGITPFKYIEEQRFDESKRLLAVGENSIEEIAFKLEFNSSASFSKQFKKWSGVSPSEYRQQIKVEKHVVKYLGIN